MFSSCNGWWGKAWHGKTSQRTCLYDKLPRIKIIMRHKQCSPTPPSPIKKHSDIAHIRPCIRVDVRYCQLIACSLSATICYALHWTHNTIQCNTSFQCKWNGNSYFTIACNVSIHSKWVGCSVCKDCCLFYGVSNAKGCFGSWILIFLLLDFSVCWQLIFV